MVPEPGTISHLLLSYSSAGASTGQTPAHEPHPMQADSSITKVLSPCYIHPTGHSAA